MGASFQPGDIVVTRKRITRGPNGNVIQADTFGIVVGKKSEGKIGVQFELRENETTRTIRCFISNLKSVA